MARNQIGAAVARAAARIPGLLQCRIFRPALARGRSPKPTGHSAIETLALASERQLHVAGRANFRLRWRALRYGRPVS